MAKNENKENKERDFSRILANAGSDMSIQIKRLQPTWCDGVLVEEEIDPEDIIDLEHIREQWGGRKMKLTIRQDGAYKASTTIKFPDPPKKDGVVLINPEIAAAQAPPPPPPPQDSKLFEVILAMQKQQAEALAAIQKQNADAIKEAQTTSAAAQHNTMEKQIGDLKNQIADMRTANPAEPLPEKLSALDTIKEAAETLKEVQGLQGIMGGEGGGDSSQFNFLSEGIKQVLSMHMEKQKMEMEIMLDKQKQGRGEPKPPPLEDRPAQIQATPTATPTPTTPPDMASLAPMLQAFKSIPVEQQAALVSAHIEQLDEDERVDFLSALAGSDFIEAEAEEEEDPENEPAEPAEIKTLDITPEPN